MDLLRGCYRVPMWLRADSNDTLPATWFFADEQALYFPAPHRFGSRNYASPEGSSLLGEVHGPPRKFFSGVPPQPWVGQNYDGPLHCFQQGATAADPLLELGPDGWPAGCLEFAAGMELGGQGVQVLGPLYQPTGGDEGSGQWLFFRKPTVPGPYVFDLPDGYQFLTYLEFCAQWFWCYVPLPPLSGNVDSLDLLGVDGRVVYLIQTDATAEAVVSSIAFDYPPGFQGSKIAVFINVDNSLPVIWRNNDTGALPGEMLALPGGGSIWQRPGDVVAFLHDTSSGIDTAVWRLLWTTGAYGPRSHFPGVGLVMNTETANLDTDYPSAGGDWLPIPATGASIALDSWAGATTDAWVQVFTLTYPDGLHGVAGVKNPHVSATLDYRWRVTDLFGNTFVGASNFLSAGNLDYANFASPSSWKGVNIVTGAMAPALTFALDVKSNSPGAVCPYSVKVSHFQ